MSIDIKFFFLSQVLFVSERRGENELNGLLRCHFQFLSLIESFPIQQFSNSSLFNWKIQNACCCFNMLPPIFFSFPTDLHFLICCDNFIFVCVLHSALPVNMQCPILSSGQGRQTREKEGVSHVGS